jgi:nucleoside-diphosphate-sugar epimerase
MRVFVTGASGFVGSAVVQELLAHGHKVTGLARSDANVAALKAVGAGVHQGSLEDVESLKRGAAGADGVIHCAFNHDFSRFMENCAMDRAAIEAMGAALEGSDRPLLVTSGVANLPQDRPATEDDVPPASFGNYPRVSEATAEALAARGVKASIVRLPPTVHGEGDHGFVPILINLAREKKQSPYIGDGTGTWPAVHRLDAAAVFRLAIESGAGSVRYHAVAEAGVPFKEIATIIGKHLDVPVVSLSVEQAPEHFGWFSMFAGINVHASSEQTRKRLGWKPAHTPLIPDLDQGHYFK